MGWAAVILDWSGKTVIGGSAVANTEPRNTNNRAELLAVLRGLEYAKAESGRTEVHVYTDSAYVVNGFCLYLSGWVRRRWITKDGDAVANKDLWVQLLGAVNDHALVEWHHMRGHGRGGQDVYGYEHNALADRIAGQWRVRAT
jgi:ribonuclease HI